MDVVRVPVPTEARSPFGQTNAYLVGGEEPLLVDPAGTTDGLVEAVERTEPEHVAVTHAHPDHVGGVRWAADRGATVWARAGREGRFEAATGVAPDGTFREGDDVGPTRVLAVPGHAPDHVAFLGGDAALVGDLVVAEGSVFVGGDDGDLRAYLTALRRLRALDVGTLYPGHGPVVDRPREVVERLIAHRLDREAKVREAVRAGAATTGEIVDAAYERDLEGVRDLAALAVEAHLRKLDVEGDLAWDGERARPR